MPPHTRAEVDAQAKINLRLVILGREASGYHSLETLFHRIELADHIMLDVGGQTRSIDCGDADVGPPERNLALRAAELYAAATGWPRGFRITIDKRIPAGGGLGGGSADAGAVLRALDSLSPSPLGPRLLELAQTLGSDVPFMTLDAPCVLGWGRGERMLTLAPPPTRPVAIVFPNFRVATSDAYQWLDDDRGDLQTGHVSTSVLDAAALADWPALSEWARNDFDAVVMRRHPEIGGFLDVFRAHGATVAMLAGSGSSVIGVFEHESAAADALAATGARGVLTRTASVVVRARLTG